MTPFVKSFELQQHCLMWVQLGQLIKKIFKVRIRDGNSCSWVEFMSCRVMSILLYGLTRIQSVY